MMISRPTTARPKTSAGTRATSARLHKSSPIVQANLYGKYQNCYQLILDNFLIFQSLSKK